MLSDFRAHVERHKAVPTARWVGGRNEQRRLTGTDLEIWVSKLPKTYRHGIGGGQRKKWEDLRSEVREIIDANDAWSSCGDALRAWKQPEYADEDDDMM